ncbi:unnamed protein product [Albugo candida]|uniref:Uncharacterized protein n=1 Tax=Albugo candida TaxID=65357 RepID=A0A024G8I6_9STRA|nr:unnamed protein product [Albugo candida]|eukprot:CCI42642.1 unnamed protein product [Albugo candida]
MNIAASRSRFRFRRIYRSGFGSLVNSFYQNQKEGFWPGYTCLYNSYQGLYDSKVLAFNSLFVSSDQAVVIALSSHQIDTTQDFVER